LGAFLLNEITKGKVMSENGYWVSFEFHNGMVGTWTDYAPSADEFISNLLKMEKGSRIKRFTEFHLDRRDGKSVFPSEKISIRKYNQELKRAQQGVHPTS